MSWVIANQYYMQNGNWTICKASNVPLPYALYEGYKSHGYFKTADEAKAKYEELTK